VLRGSPCDVVDREPRRDRNGSGRYPGESHDVSMKVGLVDVAALPPRRRRCDPQRGGGPRSFQLLHTLMEVDELRLKIHPVVLGAGVRLFGGTSDKKPMRLVDTQTPRRRRRLPYLQVGSEA
jgi:hypothetical protein